MLNRSPAAWLVAMFLVAPTLAAAQSWETETEDGFTIAAIESDDGDRFFAVACFPGTDGASFFFEDSSMRGSPAERVFTYQIDKNDPWKIAMETNFDGMSKSGFFDIGVDAVPTEILGQLSEGGSLSISTPDLGYIIPLRGASTAIAHVEHACKPADF